MRDSSSPGDAEVFISYASRNRERVVQIAQQLESAGVTIWRDQNEILGGENYGPKIVAAIERSRVMIVMCSAASLESRNVHTEISLAWDYQLHYLPLLLDDSITAAYPNQVRYWLQKSQWIVVRDRPVEDWLAEVARSLQSLGILCQGVDTSTVAASPVVLPVRPSRSLDGLIQVAAFTDRIRPVRPAVIHNCGTVKRDMGGIPPEPTRSFRLSEWVSLEIDTDRPGHLLLIDVGPTGKVYCLCPSRFAPETRLSAGRTYLPQQGSPWEAFYLSGTPGRENLLAILTDEPLGLDWMATDPRNEPARVLSPADIDTLLARLLDLEADRWKALSTYFDVIA